MFRLLALSLALIVLTACRFEPEGGVDCAERPAERAYFQQDPEGWTMDETLTQMVKCVESDAAALAWLEKRAPDAPEALREILLSLYLNEAPPTEVLAELDQALLDTIFDPTGKIVDRSTLANEAVRLNNIVWTRAILEAGADPNAYGSLMAYSAVRHVVNPASRWGQQYPDKTASVPFLEAYIAHGGDPDTRAGGGFEGTVLVSEALNYSNPSATIYLVSAGANPWLPTTDSPRAQHPSLIGSYVGSRSYQKNEAFYVLIRNGAYRPPPTDELKARMDRRFLDTFELLHGTTGPNNRHTYWTLQKVVEALIEEGGYVPPPRVAELMATDRVPDAEGGWVLREGELHQDHDTPLIPNLRGSNIW